MLENHLVLDAFRRLRLQIGGANIASADRAIRVFGCPARCLLFAGWG
jgi:hypothetical protein